MSGAVLATKAFQPSQALRLKPISFNPNGHTSKEEGLGTAAMTTTEPHLSFTPQTANSSSSDADAGNPGCVCVTSPCEDKCDEWLLDSGATDHMMFDAKDFIQTSLPKRTNIANANGIISSVTGAGTVILTHTLQLPNTLLFPSLTHKLLSVSQITSDLNCLVLMYPTFYLIQDILTKEIIGRHRGGMVEAENRGGVVEAKKDNTCLQAIEIPEATVETERAENTALETLEDVVPEAVSEASVSSPSIVPEYPTPENPKVSSLNTNVMESSASYELPYRHNHGKPPRRYSPDIEERRSRYPIANYVATQGLPKPIKTFIHDISLVTSKDARSVKRDIEIMTRLSGHDNVVDLKAVYADENYVHLHLMQVALYSHENGVIHRDLKLENILLASKSSSSLIKLADLGLATYVKPSQSLHGTVYNWKLILIPDESSYVFLAIVISPCCRCNKFSILVNLVSKRWVMIGNGSKMAN
ncbi:hypothetical protein SADUNF_Sadunf04G0043300 [Salix dunnii]|uniref:Protein kinase domain-containing protein n=1 Tax=Salix dunnii TaxID=1413687 RepID=A0A835K3T5_9ROSI|nr:hypothetical protein SADUNF_Sadunf04G0043300 [Salix dunnii]